MFDIRKDTEIAPLYIKAGNKLNIIFTDKDGNEHLLVDSLSFENDLTIDHVKVLNFVDEFGLKEGFAAVLGKQ